jgi:putative phosphonate metabolism protein
MVQPGAYARYAIYWTPPPGPLARFGAEWLGWDPASSAEVDVPEFASPNLRQITARPRYYGLHATLKAPFRMATGQTEGGLRDALDRLAKGQPPVCLKALALARMGRFICLRPEGETAMLDALAAEVVRRLDPFRAPSTEAEIARRSRARPAPDADALMLRWGYPHVMERFRFHVTLTGPLKDAETASVEAVLMHLLAPLLTRPFRIDALTLMGEDAQGRFHAIGRAPLTGGAVDL